MGSTRAAVYLVVVAAFLLAACSTGGGEPAEKATGDAPPVPVSAEASGGATGATGSVAGSANAAPDFQIHAFSNENFAKDELVTLSQYVGQPVVVNFWYPSCPPCRLEMPHLEAAYQAHKGDGVQFIGVQLLGLDSVQDGQEFIEEFGITYAIGADPDGSIVRDYKVVGFPTTVFLDKNHEIARTWAGALTEDKLNELIGDLLQ